MLILRRAILVLGGVFLFFLYIDWGTSVSTLMPCQNDERQESVNDTTKQCASERSTIFVGNPPLLYTIAAWLDSHNGTVTGIATVFLAWITYGLVRLGVDQAKTNRAQLRAYVFVEWRGTFNFGVANMKPGVALSFVNRGQTPALVTRVAVSIVAMPAELPKGGELPTPVDILVQSMPVAPNALSATLQAFAERPFSERDVTDTTAIEGPRRTYIFGTVTYVDIFNLEQHTRFCCFCNPKSIERDKDGNIVTFLWTPTEEHNSF
jgi:hypothetical protein